MHLSPEQFSRLKLRHAIIASLNASIECSDNGNAMSLFNMNPEQGKNEVVENLHRFLFFKRPAGGGEISIQRLCFLDGKNNEFRKYVISCSKVAPHVEDEKHEKFIALLLEEFKDITRLVAEEAGRTIALPGTTEGDAQSASFTYSRSGHNVVAGAIGRVYDSIHAEFKAASQGAEAHR